MCLASSPDLNVCLTNWSHAIKMPKFVASAFHVCDFTADTLTKVKTPYKTLEAIIFVGSFQGEVIRWLVHKDGANLYSTSYGHFYNTKIVQFEECTFPLVRNAIISLSYDGSICVWSVLDGICLRHFPQILPKGCQKIACSNTAIEIAAVCGAFPNIFILDIQKGCVLREIRPIPKSVVCLKFFSENDTEWLFALGSNGCASYTTLTPKTASSHRFGIFSTDENVLIGAYPSPRFSFIILVYRKGYSIVALFSKEFPYFNNNHCPNIQSAIWLKEDSFALIKYDGSFEKYNLELPDLNKLSTASVIKSNGYITDKWIPSSLEDKSSAEILECKANIATLINPFAKIPFTREKIEQMPLSTIVQYEDKLKISLPKIDDSFQVIAPQNVPQLPSEGNKSSKSQSKKAETEKVKDKGKDKSKDSKKKSDSKSSSKQKNVDSNDAVTPTTENENINQTETVDIDIKYKVDPVFQLSGESNIPLPLISSFNEDIAFAFDDYIILANKNYQEYSFSLINEENNRIREESKNNQDENSEEIKKTKTESEQNGEEEKDSRSSKRRKSDKSSHSSSKSKQSSEAEDPDDYVTAQSYIITDNLITALIEGTNKGGVTINYMNGRKKSLGILHKGRIVAMCTAGEFLLTSGKDCKLNVYSIKNLETVTFYSNFVSPVTKFYFPCKKTHTSIDNCVFCATSDGIISVIDTSIPKTSNLFILTSHESQIEKIYFHPPTKLLLVQCRSLYFWSMITGNLESIMNGQQMYKYLNEMKDALLEVNDEKISFGTPRPIIARYGNFNLRAAEIDICEFAYKIGRSLDLHMNDSLKKAFGSINDLPFLVNLVSSKTASEINNTIKKDPNSNTDSKKKGMHRIHRNMNIGFSGSDSILTLNLEQVMSKTEWLYSSQVTALLLSVRISLLFALMHHPTISNSQTWSSILDVFNIFKKNPDFAYLIQITLNLDDRAHQYIFTMIKKFGADQRQRWLKKLAIIRKSNVFPNYSKFFDLLFVFVKMTFWTALENESEAAEYVQSLYNYQNNLLNYRTDLAREIIGFHITPIKPRKSIFEYFKDDNQKRDFILNCFRYSKFLLPSTVINHFIQDSYINYLNVCSTFVRNNVRKIPIDCLKIIGNLAFAIKSSERIKFADRCGIVLGLSASYFISGCSNIDLLSKMTSIFDDLSESCHFFSYKCGTDSSLIAFGSNEGTLYVYKLKKIKKKKNAKYEECFDLFEKLENVVDNSIQANNNQKNIVNSKSFTSIAQSSQGPSSPSSSSPASNASSSVIRSKSYSVAGAAANASSSIDNADDADSSAAIKMAISDNESSASSQIGGVGTQASALPVDCVVFGSIEISQKLPIHAVAISVDDSAIFAAVENTIYRVQITGESVSSASSPSFDEKSLKPKLKLVQTSNKEMGVTGKFRWENGKLKYPTSSKLYEITPSSEKI